VFIAAILGSCCSTIPDVTIRYILTNSCARVFCHPHVTKIAVPIKKNSTFNSIVRRHLWQLIRIPSDWSRTRPIIVPLSPLSFLERSAFVYPKRISIIQGARQYTWKESYDRCRQLASALKNRGIGKGDTVAVMLPNTAPMFECHFGVPMTGAVLNTLNTRLDAEAIAFMLHPRRSEGADYRSRVSHRPSRPPWP
jgi:hypothetical protein